MYPDDCKYIEINKVSIAYTDHGYGQTVLLVHGFASSSYTWEQMIACLPQKFRFICIDLKGCGYSEKKCDDRLAPFDQAMILTAFIRRLELEDIVLVGHSMGGAISLIALFYEQIRARVSRLILLDCAGLFRKLPEFIDDLNSATARNPILKFANEDLLAAAVLNQIYFDKSKLLPETIKVCGNILRLKNAKECMVASAKQIAIANLKSFHDNIQQIKIPTLIIWGEKDAIISMDDAEHFHKDLVSSVLKIIPRCGHNPQEEMPEKTAELIAEFLDISAGNSFTEIMQAPVLDIPPEPETKTGKGEKSAGPVDQFMQASGDYIRKLKMRRLIDRWSVSTFLMILFIKGLQLLKKLGFKAEENGWRKATGIFLRNEHSKFILATFRLTYLGDNTPPENVSAAQSILILRLAEYLRKNPACHWAMDWGFFMAKRKKIFFTDIIEAEFDHDGLLLRLVPFFDNTRQTFTLLNDAIIEETLKQFIAAHNALRKVDEKKRAWKIYRRTRRWAGKVKELSYVGKSELRHLVDRIFNSTFIQIETLPDAPEQLTRSRLATPNMKSRRHPGFGLLNIVCRFTADYKEANLWFQHHHVPVDGMPMQEMLLELKKEWGEAGPVKYPALDSNAAKPEVFYFGNKLFRARVYVNFEKFIKLRKYLNTKHYVRMGGPATVSSMIIWGLAQQKYFRERKFLFPVDSSLIKDYPQERNISLIFIRPHRFFNEKNPLKGFLRYQREFNQRMFATRLGKSESYELLELYAMIHPLFYSIAKNWMPKAMGELVGTAGITILKDAEMFVSPLTDLQMNGFIALGNLMMPTEDGKKSGAVSICGSREQVGEYIKAIYHLTENYPDYLNIKL